MTRKSYGIVQPRFKSESQVCWSEGRRWGAGMSWLKRAGRRVNTSFLLSSIQAFRGLDNAHPHWEEGWFKEWPISLSLHPETPPQHTGKQYVNCARYGQPSWPTETDNTVLTCFTPLKPRRVFLSELLPQSTHCTFTSSLLLSRGLTHTRFFTFYSQFYLFFSLINLCQIFCNFPLPSIQYCVAKIHPCERLSMLLGRSN